MSKTEIDAAAILTNAAGTSPFLLVCEHASNHIPAQYNDLGLDSDVIQSHAAWDPGALAVSQFMAEILNARLVSSTVSRLVYDCNRPPESDTAIREISEIYQMCLDAEGLQYKGQTEIKCLQRTNGNEITAGLMTR